MDMFTVLRPGPQRGIHYLHSQSTAECVVLWLHLLIREAGKCLPDRHVYAQLQLHIIVEEWQNGLWLVRTVFVTRLGSE
jgi:hypothetical protein